jgi:hypothetical protein
MTTKSILVIGDSILGHVSGFPQSGLLKENITGFSITNKAVNGTALADWFRPADGATYVVTPPNTADYSGRIESGYEYVLVSLITNDIIGWDHNWATGFATTTAQIVDDYEAFIEHLRTTHGYAYSKILFRFTYPINADAIVGGEGFNTILSEIHDLLSLRLTALGVTIVDEYAHAVAYEIANPGSYYIEQYTDTATDGIHPAKDQTHANAWAAELMTLIREAIKEH